MSPQIIIHVSSFVSAASMLQKKHAEDTSETEKKDRQVSGTIKRDEKKKVTSREHLAKRVQKIEKVEHTAM